MSLCKYFGTSYHPTTDEAERLAKICGSLASKHKNKELRDVAKALRILSKIAGQHILDKEADWDALMDYGG